MDSLDTIKYSLARWYDINKRSLPWRETRDAYFIWLSEVILQQTQVKQGQDYYIKFTKQFPTVFDLAAAKQDEVLKLWQGLGYYSRARNLHAAAKQVVSEFNGVFPNNYTDILKLKGVGEYTAAAISSIAFNLPYAVVDGNVARVLSRLFGVTDPVNETKGKKLIQHLADELLGRDRPGQHNQAIMEFGALYCKPANPDCVSCILNAHCEAYNKNLVKQLPVKTKKVKPQKRFFYYLVILDEEHVWVQQRQHDIWQGLYEFPLIDSDKKLGDDELINKIYAYPGIENAEVEINFDEKNYRHILTHRVIMAQFITIKLKTELPLPAVKIKKDMIQDLPVSRLIEKYLDSGEF